MNYLEQIQKLKEYGLLPKRGVMDVEVEHDLHCGIFQHQECRCNCELYERLPGGKRRRLKVPKEYKDNGLPRW